MFVPERNERKNKNMKIKIIGCRNRLLAITIAFTIFLGNFQLFFLKSEAYWTPLEIWEYDTAVADGNTVALTYNYDYKKVVDDLRENESIYEYRTYFRTFTPSYQVFDLVKYQMNKEQTKMTFYYVARDAGFSFIPGEKYTSSHNIHLRMAKDGEPVYRENSTAYFFPTFIAGTDNLTGIKLSKENLKLLTGTVDTLVPSFEPETTRYRSVFWTSSNENVATVDDDGAVNAVSEGTATITATSTAYPDISVSCEVTVTQYDLTPISSLGLNITQKEMPINSYIKLIATTVPNNIPPASLKWTSSDPDVAVVGGTDGKIMPVTAKSNGEATITVETTDGSNLSASFKISVTGGNNPSGQMEDKETKSFFESLIKQLDTKASLVELNLDGYNSISKDLAKAIIKSGAENVRLRYKQNKKTMIINMDKSKRSILLDHVDAKSGQINLNTLGFPVYTSPLIGDNPQITSGFYRKDGGYHGGLDMQAHNVDVYAIVGGTIIASGWENTKSGPGIGGQCIIIQGDDGMYYQYAHLSVIGVTSGRVEAGTKIGVSGQSSYGKLSGKGTVDLHLHVDIGVPEVKGKPGAIPNGIKSSALSYYGFSVRRSSRIDPEAYLRSVGIKFKGDATTDRTNTITATQNKTDGSSKGTPAKLNTALRNTKGITTGYKVTSANKKAPKVAFAGTNAQRKSSKVTIAKITKDCSGNKYSVTSIAAKAFYKAKTKTVVVANTVNACGKDAFNGAACKSITFNMNKKGNMRFAKNSLKLKNQGKHCTITVKGVAKKNQSKVKKAMQKAGARKARIVFKL